MTTDLCFMTATDLAAAIAGRRVSPVEAVDAYIARIERLDGHYLAYAETTFERAREQARAAERACASGAVLGPLHGVPVAVKDLFDTAQVPTRCGSLLLAQHVPATSAAAVERLEAAGAILLGKLRMTEFAGIEHHPALPAPRNPYSNSHSPGGSSSGSGVAVVAGLCAAALGSDTVASIRNPAAWNGCVGLKPTWGRVSRRGVFPLAACFDHVGPMTRSVRDAALLLRVLAGHDPADPTSLRETPPAAWPRLDAPRALRVGHDEAFTRAGTHPVVVAPVLEALDALQSLGATVTPVSIPMTDASIEHYDAIMLSDVAEAHSALRPTREHEYGPAFRSVLRASDAVSRDALVRAHRFRAAFADAIDHLFTQVDLLVMPVAPMNAPPIVPDLTWTRPVLNFLRFTFHWNLIGIPAISLPWGLDAEGLPCAVQLVGPRGGEERVLAAARQLERGLPRPRDP